MRLDRNAFDTLFIFFFIIICIEFFCIFIPNKYNVYKLHTMSQSKFHVEFNIRNAIVFYCLAHSTGVFGLASRLGKEHIQILLTAPGIYPTQDIIK